MDISNLKRLQSQRNPANISDISAATSKGGWQALPKKLEELLSASNGFLTPEGNHLYGTDDIVERNETFEIKEYCEGYILIGDTSGGKGYLMHIQHEDSSIYSSDLGDLDIPGFHKEANSLQEWIDGLK